jgi:hypothetical protein
MDETQIKDTPLQELTFLQTAGLLVDVQGERKSLEKSVEDLKKKEGRIKEVLIDKMQKGEAPSVKIKGKTVFLHRSLWATINYPEGMPDEEKPAYKKAALQALKEAGEGVAHLVYETCNSQSVSAYMRNELPEDEETGMPEWPEELKKFWTATEQFDVRLRKA